MHENYFVQNNMIFLVIFYYYWWFACYCIWFQVTGNRLGAILQSVFTIVLAVCGGIYYEWRLGLAGASYVPMLLLSSTFHAKIIASHDNIEKEALARSAKVSSRFYSVFFSFFLHFLFFFSVGYWGHHEYSHSGWTWPWENLCAPIHPRTGKTSSRGQEKISHSWPRFWLCPVHAFLRLCWNNVLRRISSRQKRVGVPKCLQVSRLYTVFENPQKWLIYGFLWKIIWFDFDKGNLNFCLFFRVAEALILGTIMVGQATAFAPNYNKAVLAAARVFRLLDRRPLIDSQGQSGVRLVSSQRFLMTLQTQKNPLFLCRIDWMETWPLKRPIFGIRQGRRFEFFVILTLICRLENEWLWLDHRDVASPLVFSFYSDFMISKMGNW